MGLPDLRAFRAEFRCQHDGVLPGLPTTALHGAFGHALREQVCAAPARPACAGCPAEPTCAYPRLFDTRAANSEGTTDPPPGRPPGIREDVPRPMVIAPESPRLAPDLRPLAVRKGETVAFRLVFVGSAVALVPQVAGALRRAGQMGLGARTGRPGRVTLGFLGLDEVLPEAEIGPLDRARLQWISPLRLKIAGQFSTTIDGPSLAIALVRRARALASLYGDPAWEPGFHPRECGLGVQVRADLRPVEVERLSTRQGRTMRWQAVIGDLHLQGAALRELWPLIRFGQWAQVGKGTTFGLGRYAVRPD